jgi:hypothetical protein
MIRNFHVASGRRQIISGADMLPQRLWLSERTSLRRSTEIRSREKPQSLKGKTLRYLLLSLSPAPDLREVAATEPAGP